MLEISDFSLYIINTCISIFAIVYTLKKDADKREEKEQENMNAIKQMVAESYSRTKKNEEELKIVRNKINKVEEKNSKAHKEIHNKLEITNEKIANLEGRLYK